MKLIGSTTSPYVRKIRLLLEGQKYDFETLKALSPEGMKRLEVFGSVKRIPILIDGKNTIFDSSLISEYLLEKKSIVIPLQEKLILKLIDELCDSGISLFQQRLWGIDPEWLNEHSIRMLGRANSILHQLESIQSNGGFSDLQKDWLYCVLAWLNFRSIINWSGRKNLTSLYQKLDQLEKYESTSYA